MNISIFGLGYVGSVGLACLAKNGHRVVGVDVSRDKVDVINQGRSPIVERELDGLIAGARAQGMVSATPDGRAAVLGTDVSFICVGTPPTPQGHLNLDGIYKVARDIGAGIAEKKSFHVVAIRSTVLPGTNEKVTAIIEDASGKKRGQDFAVVSNPEFLREGTAVQDYSHPPYTLVGSADPRALDIMKAVYEGIDGPFIASEIKVAELIKYVNNSFHALKISFANEVGSICKALGIDSHALMDIFCRDHKLNIAPYYLKPGFAYGGSCLPKDLKALGTIAHDHYLKCPVIEGIEPSNEVRKNTVLEKILEFGKSRIGFLGLSFKEGTDDLRSSPIIDVLEKLLGKGLSVRIYDRNVELSKLVGANREFILQRIPLISKFVSDDVGAVVAGSDVIVVVNKEEGFREILAATPADKIIYDLVNIDFPGRAGRTSYHGIAW
ncbi:MAG TPA: UDP-glucose/GDP-mannose dehydrogenase family protein [Acidobacteriota bacterium]|nr:UDP-glucose/GDP-mannose dehydrogenase family protein [Acidobacteriota bacterium]